MSLFEAPILCQLTKQEYGRLMAPLKSDLDPKAKTGGAQGLVRELRSKDIGGRCLQVERTLLDEAYVKSELYGGGTYQNMWRAVLSAAYRAGYTPPDKLGESKGGHGSWAGR